GIDFSERRGIDELALATAVSSLELLADLGEWDEAIALADSLAARAEASGATIDLLQARSARARLCAHRGETGQASVHAGWLVATARETGEAQIVAQAFSAAALASLVLAVPQRTAGLLAELERASGARETPYYA